MYSKKDINKSFIFRNLVFNTFLVILGYGLAGLTNSQSNLIFQPLKVVFLLYSMVRLRNLFTKDEILARVIIFSVLTLLTIPFSINPLESFTRVLTFLLPLIYTVVSLQVLFNYYHWKQILFSFLKAFRVIFAIPVVSFTLFGGDLSDDIYGHLIGAYVSNHYGWSCYIVITSQLILIFKKKASSFSFWTVFSIGCLFLLAASSSRSSYLSLFLGILILLTEFNFRRFLIISIGIVAILSVIPDFNLRLDKTFDQYNSEETVSGIDQYVFSKEISGDTRTAAREIGYYIFLDNPKLLFTGFGIFQFKEAVYFYNNRVNQEYYNSGIHNSYGEILFGGGAFIFIYFMFYFIIPSLVVYVKFFRGFLFNFIGLVLVIPFFESNLTAGQFLFYPWFILVFFMLYYKKNYKKNVI